MLEKILRKLGYVKIKQEVNETEKKRIEKLKNNFNELMTYSLVKAVKGDK
jgi:hypothetical protein